MLSMLKCEEIKAQAGEAPKVGLSLEMREAIRETVIDTVKELKRSGFLRRQDDVAYSEISSKLYAYYKDPASEPEVGKAIQKIKTDDYYDVLPQYYKQKLTLDWIAEGYRCDYITISRNKKRLCLKIYNILERQKYDS